MNGRGSELRDAFVKAGWHELDRQPEDGEVEFGGVFVGDFATCAVVQSDSARVVTRWADFQGLLAQLKLDGVIDRAQDLYLLFVIDIIEDAELGELQRALDDPLVCRKICVERRGRDLTETLNDVPFFSTPTLDVGDETEPPSSYAPLAGVPEGAQHDLVHRSAEAILDKLLAGDYEEK